MNHATSRDLGATGEASPPRCSAVGVGRTLAGVALHVGAAVSSVFRWRQAYRRKGGRGLCPRCAARSTVGCSGSAGTSSSGRTSA